MGAMGRRYELHGRSDKVHPSPVPGPVLEGFSNNVTVSVGDARWLPGRGEVAGQPADHEAPCEDVFDTCANVRFRVNYA